MCGILTKIDFRGNNVNADIITDYINQRKRGIEGFGFAYTQDKKMFTKRSVDERGIITKLLKCPSPAVLFHHRNPTSTDNVIESCHPFVIQLKKDGKPDGKLALIHNGIVYNADELYENHKKAGHNYMSYDKKTTRHNDSESLAIDVARYLSGEQDEIEAYGWIAFIAFRTDVKGRLTTVYFARNSKAELKFKFTNMSLTVGSEIEGKDVEIDTLYTLTLEDQKLNKTDLYFPMYTTGTSDKGAYGYGDDYDEYGRDWGQMKDWGKATTQHFLGYNEKGIPMYGEDDPKDLDWKDDYIVEKNDDIMRRIANDKKIIAPKNPHDFLDISDLNLPELDRAIVQIMGDIEEIEVEYNPTTEGVDDKLEELYELLEYASDRKQELESRQSRLLAM